MTIFLQLHFSLPLASTIAQSVKKKKKKNKTKQKKKTKISKQTSFLEATRACSSIMKMVRSQLKNLASSG
jgi:hypothetical protein